MPAVKLERVGRVARILLNMPEKMNAMTSQVVDDFGKVLDTISTNASEYGAVVITGAGNSFSAGGDLAWLKLRSKDTASRNSQIMHDFYHRFLAIRSLPLPVVAAINGPAVGAGMCLAMACDIRVASETAKMGFPFVSLGLHPGMGATHIIASVAGYETAYRLLLTGDLVTGKEAKELRLVSRLAADGPSAQAEAMALAERIARQAPVAVRSVVRSLRRKQEEGLEAALWREADARSSDKLGVKLAAALIPDRMAQAQAHCYATHDLQEGLKASPLQCLSDSSIEIASVDRLRWSAAHPAASLALSKQPLPRPFEREKAVHPAEALNSMKATWIQIRCPSQRATCETCAAASKQCNGSIRKLARDSLRRFAAHSLKA